jgi:parvulin-like peptidyl-prolyl isomerase
MRPASALARPLALVPVLAVLAALLAGCSSGPPVLATVGKTKITSDDFLDVARRSQSQYPGPADSARAALLEDMVRRELLVGEAQKRGLVPVEEQTRARQQAEEQLTLRALIERSVPREVPVSDAEVQALYRARAFETHALLVFTPDRPAIEAAQAEIAGGADFGTIADRFNTTGMTPKGGDMNFVVAGALMPALDSLITNGAVGKVLGPVESPGDGWFLVKLLERRPRKQEPLEQIREQMTAGLRQAKQRVLFNRVQQGLLAQYHVAIEPGAAQALFMRYNAPKDTLRSGNVRLPVAAAPTPEEAKRVLMRYDGADGKPAQYTLGDAVRDLQDPQRVHPNFSVMPMIEQWLRSVGLQRVALIEARRQHLGEEPSLVRQARGQVENQLLQAAYQALVMNSIGLSEADVHAAYERHAAQLVGKDGVPMDFAKLDPQIRQALQAEAMELRRDQRLRQVTDSLRAVVRPQVHAERLKNVPWPVPQAPPGS